MLFPCKFEPTEPTEPKFGLCDSCLEGFENSVNKIVSDFGISDKLYCGECGLQYLKYDFLKHPCVTNAQT